MRNFKGWHILAGLAAMAVAAPLGSLMGLNFVATFMFAGVAFVAVAFWVDNRLARRRTARPDAGDLPLRDPADS
ncbi:hypothetical protein [Arthrobacter cupressi]|uniref:hypothetical protein n=1 Tax=Arthrobacter cupressi TaxID=1045773 RepID=UPI000943A180|nr:hypothetical protein [Arthrobacter cupressi]NYD77791.1 membrane protein implicated in regulation of membrane protease activity [Arthrobacter cupressi]